MSDGVGLWDYVRMLLPRLPSLLAVLLGIVLAIVARRRAPGAALLLLIGSVISLVALVSWPLASYILESRAADEGWGGERIRDYWQVITLLAGIADAAGVALIAIAVVVGRSGAIAVPILPPAVPGDYGSFDRPVAPLSKGFFIGGIVGGTVATWILVGLGFGQLAIGRDSNLVIGGTLMAASFLPLAFVVVVVAILLHRLWSALPREFARTTPGKAVGLLFVPFFNLYWGFQAWWGWTVDYNRYIAERRIPGPRAPEGLALAFVILSILAAIPYIGVIFALVNLVLFITLVNQAIDGVAAISWASRAAGQTSG